MTTEAHHARPSLATTGVPIARTPGSVITPSAPPVRPAETRPAGGAAGEPAACCAPTEQASCCAPSEKSTCCGSEATAGGGCGCR